MRQHARDEILVDAAPRRLVAVAVERRAGARAHEIVDQRIARTGIAGDRIAAIDKSDIGDAANIEHGDRMRPLEIARQRLMEHRHQRRALPAGGDIGGAEIIEPRSCSSRRASAAPSPICTVSRAAGLCSTVWP